MEIAIFNPGMPVGPDTLKTRSLGGSETAALMLATKLAERGNLVTLFTNLPPKDREDAIDPHKPVEKGTVRFLPLEFYGDFIQDSEVDLLIVSRAFEALRVNHQAKKAVLWMHDLATQSIQPRLMDVGFNFDEIWCVSQFHKKQIAEQTGYPEHHIKVIRNGIVKFDMPEQTPIRNYKQLLYAARPERGLEALVKSGGIMERLPDFHLNVTLYENFPEQLRDFYTYLFKRCEELPNVTMLGPKTQSELRELMSESAGYIYPTLFEEVSCIIARECIEQHLPIYTTRVGALPETIGQCGYLKDVGDGNTMFDSYTDQFCEEFAEFFKGAFTIEEETGYAASRCALRDDLYWDDVAATVELYGDPAPVAEYSRLFSLIEDSDIIPAMAYAKTIQGADHLKKQLENNYPFLTGHETIEDYYARWFSYEDNNHNRRNPVGYPQILKSGRYRAIAMWVASLPEGSTILDYGCAEGTISLNLAKMFPNHFFYGVDFQQSNIDLAKKFAEEVEAPNWAGQAGDAMKGLKIDRKIDAVLCTEVLEHTVEPWNVLNGLEAAVPVGVPIMITVPHGPWEMLGLRKKEQWGWRNHIWHINKWMLRKMLADKEGVGIQSHKEGVGAWARSIGHLVAFYTSDQKPVPAIDPLQKAQEHWARQTATACIICKDGEESILKMLNSIDPKVQAVRVFLGGSKDRSALYIDNWAKDHPWCDVRIKHGPAVEAQKFGFDDARNASIKNVETDWVLWIDTDEYLSGEALSGFMRENAFDAYAIHQHHFTCDPRGTPTQMDKPARMFRVNRGFKFFGKVHEHAELGANKGPGFTYLLPGVDIGHTGYVNEFVRRSRFGRNYPLLEWDRIVNPDRKLGKFLWLRDLIHVMRLKNEEGDVNGAREGAQKAIDFYEQEKENMLGVGGGNTPLQYVSEARKFLGRGHEIQVLVKIEDKEAAVAGVFENTDEVIEELQKFLEEQKTQLTSRYRA